MRVIGLTGGIASGKTSVAHVIEGLGIPVVDADEVAREVVAPGSPALAAIRAEFGDEVLGPDGGLCRTALADRVFSDPERRRRLEAGQTHSSKHSGWNNRNSASDPLSARA